MTPEGEGHAVLFASLAVAMGATPDDALRIAATVLGELDHSPVNADTAMAAVARIEQLTR